jgi:hypothetical protein
MSLRPEFVTNRKGETVAKALAGYWQDLLDAMKEPPTLAISPAYFNPGGFSPSGRLSSSPTTPTP